MESDRPQQVLIVRDRTRAGHDHRVARRIPEKRYAVDRAAGDAADRQRVAIAGIVPSVMRTTASLSLGIVDVGEGGERGERNGRCVLDIGGGGIDGEDRRVVHRHDTDHRGCHVAGVHAVADDHLDEAVFGGGIVAGVAVDEPAAAQLRTQSSVAVPVSVSTPVAGS